MNVWLYHKVLPGGKIFTESEITQELIDAGWVDSPEELKLHEFGRTDADSPRGNTSETVHGHNGTLDNRSGSESDGQGNKSGGSADASSERSIRGKGRPKKESSVDSEPRRNTLLSPARHVV